MKVVLFCGGLGTRIRDYSEDVPKPMIPIGSRPILWHVMQYYSQHGFRDFILCLGYKAQAVKDYFLGLRPNTYRDCVISDFGQKVELIGENAPDWRITLVDTGIPNNIGERLLTVMHLLRGEEYFLANYSDGLTSAPLLQMIDQLKASGKTASFVAVRPSFNFHLAEFSSSGQVTRFRSSQEADMWINGGFFVFRSDVFNYIRPGEELILEPFSRMIEANQLLGYKYDGFWRAMDTLRDRQVLEEMANRGETPWLEPVSAMAAVA